MSESKKERVKQKINTHLRNITRRLIKFDTLEETLNHLLDSFYMEFTCDLVAVILTKGKQKLVPKVWKGEGFTIENTLRLDLETCSPNLLQDALWGPKSQENVKCQFRNALEQEHLSTWFTVPLKYNDKSYGLCVIGFKDFVPLIIEADKIFAEFGQDVAIAIDLALEKERQKRKIKGIEWLRENIFPGSSIENVIAKIVERAGRGTSAKGAAVYLFDDIKNCFTLHLPFYGTIETRERIFINIKHTINDYFPNVEETGGSELTVPLVVNLKTIGALYVCKENDKRFSDGDLDFLKFVSAYVSMQIENARLYKAELDGKKRLENIIEHHQLIVQKVVVGEDIKTIAETISSYLDKSLFLFDRFLRPITFHLKEEEASDYQEYMDKILLQKQQILRMKDGELWIDDDQDGSLSIWPILGNREVFGYLVLCIPKKRLDRVFQITLDYALNVFAFEFIKQKLVLDANEQVKENFVNQLFSESVEDQDKIIQYATLINWNVIEPHRIGVLTFDLDKDKERTANLVVLEGYKSWLWEQIKLNLSLCYPNIVFTRKGDEFILIVDASKESNQASAQWKKIYERMNQLVKKENPLTHLFLGVGGKTEKLEDYYFCYMQASKANNVVSNRNKDSGFSFYEDLGSYTVLNNANNQMAAELFVKKNLGPLIKYTETNHTDLFTTLQVFLNNNGNFKDAADQLFIHRSTLEYRIQRISKLLEIDINNADVRFELMMAYKLFDLFHFNRNQLL